MMTRCVERLDGDFSRDTFVRRRQSTNLSINTFWARRRLACTPLEGRSPWA